MGLSHIDIKNIVHKNTQGGGGGWGFRLSAHGFSDIAELKAEQGRAEFSPREPRFSKKKVILTYEFYDLSASYLRRPF